MHHVDAPAAAISDFKLESSETEARNAHGHWETTDEEVAYKGREKAARIDLGLAILSANALPGECYDLEEIAAFAGCSDTYILEILRGALRKFRKGLEAVGVGELDERVIAVALRQVREERSGAAEGRGPMTDDRGEANHAA